MQTSLLKTLSIALVLLLLSGCSDITILTSNMAENDANDVVAELNRFHIDAEKRMDKNGVTLMIAREDMERAVNILNAAGLPHRARTNMGEIFQKSGVISSPMEERARYIYALSQEVESTLAQIDGVVAARVHVVLPERIAPGEPVQPASASVLIKYQGNLDPDSIEPRIRRLVSTSIPGLTGKDDRDLAIIFVPATVYHDRVETVMLGPFSLSPGQYSLTKWVFSFICLLLVITVAVLVLKPGLKLKRSPSK